MYQSPRKLGKRFSINAFIPSFWSSVAKVLWNRRRSKCMPSDNDDSYARLTDSLIIMTEGSDIEAMTVAASSVSSINRSAATTLETRPARSASLASIKRAVRHMSIALALDTARGKR